MAPARTMTGRWMDSPRIKFFRESECREPYGKPMCCIWASYSGPSGSSCRTIPNGFDSHTCTGTDPLQLLAVDGLRADFAIMLSCCKCWLGRSRLDASRLILARLHSESTCGPRLPSPEASPRRLRRREPRQRSPRYVPGLLG